MKKTLIATSGLIVICFMIFLWLGNKDSIQPVEGCESNAELSVYCNFMNPEDLALTPDDKFLIVAEFGGMAPLVEMTLSLIHI